MSDSSSQYASFILKKYFGEASIRTTHTMFVRGAVTFPDILRDCSRKLNPRRTSRCLLSLIKHGVVKISAGKALKYNLDHQHIFCLPRFPIYCQLVFHFYGKVAQEVMFFLSLVGRITIRDLLDYCLTYLNERKDLTHDYIEDLSNNITTLMRTNVLRTVNPKQWSEPLPEQPTEKSNPPPPPTTEPLISKEELSEILHEYVSQGCKVWPGEFSATEPARKRLKLSDNLTEAFALLNRVVSPNIETLESMWRDRMICQLASEKLGEVCGDILSRLLCVATAAGRNTEITSTESGAVSRPELMRSFRNIPEYFDSNMALLTDDEINFLIQQPGLGSYMYTCPYKVVIKQILIKHIEYVIQILFGHSGLRIFRLILTVGPLNLEEIERRVLLAQNDFRRMLPRMVTNGFITTTELSKTKDYTSETIYCLYSVNLQRIARILIELAQHSALRIGLRREFELAEKSRLIEQRYRIETLIEQHENKLSALTENKSSDNNEDLDELITQHKESIEALSSAMTPGELQQLSTLSAKSAKLIACEYESHATWFIADLFLRLYTV